MKIVKNCPPMRQIVAVMIDDTITNKNEHVAMAMQALAKGHGKNIQLLNRLHMQFMAAADLGERWTALAKGPTFFGLDKKGRPCLVEGGVWKPKK